MTSHTPTHETNHLNAFWRELENTRRQLHPTLSYREWVMLPLEDLIQEIRTVLEKHNLKQPEKIELDILKLRSLYLHSHDPDTTP